MFNVGILRQMIIVLRDLSELCELLAAVSGTCSTGSTTCSR